MDKSKLTLDELRALVPTRSRRQSTSIEDEATEYKRLLANYKSRLYKQRLKESYTVKAGKKYELTDKDIRMYKNCFLFEKDYLTDRMYIKRMTGLTDKQIYYLQIETGLKGYPAVSRKEI